MALHTFHITKASMLHLHVLQLRRQKKHK